jgi:uncharacterized membrane protein
MKTIKKSVRIQAAPSAVYSYLVDANNMPRWLSSMEEIRNIKGKGVGQTYDWTYKMIGVHLKGSTKVLADEPNKLRKTQTKGGANSTWTFAIEPDGKFAKLNLTIDYEIPVPVLGKLAEKLVVKHNEREAEASLEHLKDLVEDQARRQHAAE